MGTEDIQPSLAPVDHSQLVPTTDDDYSTRLIKSSISHGILKFGTFELKSGRSSPYFYNSGLFNTGFLLNLLGLSYASKIIELKDELEFDVIFGPAYKGIPIASITAAELNRLDPLKYHSLGFSFDRKEAKTHGEGGSIIGSPLEGKRVLIVDDVITAGTAIRQSIKTIEQHGGHFVGVLVNLDRQEKSNDSELSAIEIVEAEFKTKVHSIIKLNQIIDLLKSIDGYQNELLQMENYRKQWGIQPAKN
ncbi:orotate phosphoribosyltransferase [Puccinia graminis f. sp. tritici]|uniref:orotate phosphoribosyltransferase n=1 Tax=Puccinia graminis f. sp. tritici TaxID=56615 RepID=A0A5B0MKK9_PUCGR|nr:orotate phosphoribosyltransferase [Puccinia graminis f. sp. tritici]KAA1092857.1 orotate phosphoribosyltransferase [Puccinia graminis f. sp. tritici]